MGSRGLLWGLLALGALPLVLEATTGCNPVFDLEETKLQTDNALTCNCECKPTTPDPIVSVRIPSDDDDAEQTGASMDLGSSTLDLGARLVGVRFTNLAIPPGATILGAKVRFTASDSDGGDADFTVAAESSTSPAPFSTADNDLSGRTVGTPVPWDDVPAWSSGISATPQETPELRDLIQPLVDDSGWSNASTLVLRIAGTTGLRRARSHDDSSSRSALLDLVYTTGVSAALPVCAAPGVAHNGDVITPAALVSECQRVEQTLEGLAGPCGYPTDCTCTVEDRPGQDDSFEQAVCNDACVETPLADMCTNFDPNRFQRCVELTGDVEQCKQDHVTATNAAGGSPVCVPSGSPLAFHAFGSRILCELEGTSHIEIGDREPTQDPETEGRVEFLGKPCPGEGCRVLPYFDLTMDPITFSVKWASDPTFTDLSAAGRGLETSVIGGGEASFGFHTIEGSGNGQRLNPMAGQPMTLTARNSTPLDFGIDFATRECDMFGTLSAGADDDGVCENDNTIPCASDGACAGVGGPCILPPDTEDMKVTVALSGDLLNQPPTAEAGPDEQRVECTSSAGAPFALDGHGSSDPDENLALASWREGSRTGPLIVNGMNAELALGLGASQSYVLRVIDSFAQTDEDETSVSVVDETPPVIACNAPATIRPPDAVISFGATATDVCDDAVTAAVTGYDCFTFTKKGRRVSKLESCIVSFAGNTVTVHDVGGYGDHITWTVEAPDDSGNLGEATCEVVVTK